jgi:hypothetical protein
LVEELGEMLALLLELDLPLEVSEIELARQLDHLWVFLWANKLVS